MLRCSSFICSGLVSRFDSNTIISEWEGSGLCVVSACLSLCASPTKAGYSLIKKVIKVPLGGERGAAGPLQIKHGAAQRAGARGRDTQG